MFKKKSKGSVIWLRMLWNKKGKISNPDSSLCADAGFCGFFHDETRSKTANILSHLFSFPLGMTERRSVLFLSLQTYVFLLVIPADAVLFCRETDTIGYKYGHLKHYIPLKIHHDNSLFSFLINSHLGRWWRLSCGRGCRPCWGCWRCPAEGWRVEPHGCPGWWVYAAGLHLPPWCCSRPWWSDSSLDETSLEGRSDRLQRRKKNKKTQTQKCDGWVKDVVCTSGEKTF